jgi:hypothetical protein
MTVQLNLKNIALAIMLCIAVHGRAISQQDVEGTVKFQERNLSGPRLGFAIIPGGSMLSQAFKAKGMSSLVSQFGWHSEFQVIPAGGGPSFLIEFITMIGGVEYGNFIPSATLAFGIRLPNGIEFGMGPNLSALSFLQSDWRTALMMAVGKTFDYGGVSIPLNFAYITNPVGDRFALIVGYAIQRSSK